MPARIRSFVAIAAFAAAMTATAASAQKRYDPGASDTEIKIGNIMPYSGPASAYGVIGKAEAAYFKKINEEGGINGRKINFISYDDAFSPPKAVEQARKLVESDEVLLIFQPLGTQSNSATQKYMNAKKVPQLFVATGATKWGDPKNFPWTMGWQPNYQSEGRIYAAYILKNYPNGKIAALWHRAKGGGAGDPQGRRTRLEAGIFPRQRLNVGRDGSQAGWPGKCEGHHLDRLFEGSDRSGVEGRSRDQDLACFHGQIFSGWRQDQ
jgi:Periplasmic binding protein